MKQWTTKKQTNYKTINKRKTNDIWTIEVIQNAASTLSNSLRICKRSTKDKQRTPKEALKTSCLWLENNRQTNDNLRIYKPVNASKKKCFVPSRSNLCSGLIKFASKIIMILSSVVENKILLQTEKKNPPRGRVWSWKTR